ncbi:MAG: ATP-dependent DNA helicase RecG, partial [Candidatus Gottesmanbacteria bacterium]
MNLDTPVQTLFMVGPVYGRRLEKLGIKSIGNMLNHLPHRYEDYSHILAINRAQPGETVTLQAVISQIKNEYTKNGKKIQKALITDGTKELEIIWFNQPFLTRTIKIGDKYNFSGKIDWFGHKIVMISPEYEQLSGNRYQLIGAIHTGRLVPVYPETYGISSKWLRSRIAPLLIDTVDLLTDYLPQTILQKNNLINYKEAINQIHFPQDKENADLAKNRLAFDELFLIQLASQKRKNEWASELVGHKFQISIFKDKIKQFFEKLPFRLTNAQRKATIEILTDLAKTKPMNRLLEGDVGSGKTVVAAIAIYLSYLNHYQAILMAPTEILANQHFATLKGLLEPLGLKLVLITGHIKSASSNQRQKYDVIIGTHALLYETLLFKNVGLIVIDEQHRFGVEQRTQLKSKGINPHLLTMTATPIPRTVALTLYGELDLSFLDEMPHGRIKIKTWVVPSEKRIAAYEWIKTKVKNTREQAFIICPLIEESETLTTIKAATKEYDHLQKEVFPDIRLGLLHGRLKSKEKEMVLDKFRRGDLDILIATPVVEVGIDIPNATIMMVEGADRFGLAQLHQLRGRVGRANLPSYCLLFSEAKSHNLKAMEKINIGAKLAELDLKIRGPGEIYGTKQHGIPDLKAASLSD